MSSLSPSALETLRRNRDGILERIAAAAARSGRDAEAVRLVAVTKSVGDPVAAALVRLGQRDLGENRPETVPGRAAALASEGLSPRWHMIGRYQRRKIGRTLPYFHCVHSVHDRSLLERLGPGGPAGPLRVPPRLLLQVNLSGEESKQGFTAESVVAALDAAREEELPVVGLMTMAPYDSDEGVLREVFAGLRELRDRLDPGGLPELSMGMSGDYGIAVEEGSTLVRVGTALYEGLEP